MIIDLETVRARLAALDLMDRAEVIPDYDEMLSELEISEQARDALGPLVVTNGYFKATRFEYDPWDQTVLAFIVNGPDDESPLDVVAFALGRPERFGTRLGQASILGISNLHTCENGLCPLLGNPLEWLRENGRGVCILDPTLAAPLVAAAKCDFAVPDLELGRRLLRSGAVAPQKLFVPDTRAA
jgi:hypothetical protein